MIFHTLILKNQKKLIFLTLILLIISEQSSSYIQINKIISSYKCKASQIKLLNNLNFNLSTLLLNDNKQIFTDIHLENLLQREKSFPSMIYIETLSIKKILIIGAGVALELKFIRKSFKFKSL